MNMSSVFTSEDFDPVSIVLSTDSKFEKLCAAAETGDADDLDDMVQQMKESGELCPDCDIDDYDEDDDAYEEDDDDSTDMLDAEAEDMVDNKGTFDPIDDGDGELIDHVTGHTGDLDPTDEDYEVRSEFDNGTIENGYNKSDNFTESSDLELLLDLDDF